MEEEIIEPEPLSNYEVAQLKLIEEWKALEPSIANKVLGTALGPVIWLVRKVIPQKAIQGAIDGASSLGQLLSDSKDLLRDGKVNQISELKNKDLELSDKLANEVHNW